VRIATVATRRYVFPFDPPLRVAWDPVPRTQQESTLVIVRSDDGVEGYASGDALPDRELLERLLVGVDPLRTEVVHELCETVDFHHARPWTAEAAVWDLVGRALDIPCWQLLGGRSDRLVAYASNAELLSADERVARVVALRDAGIRAVKIRFHHADWRDDITTVEAVRDLIVHGGIDVIQTDVVLAGGFSGCRRVAAVADLHGRAWSPHTWSNGYGLLVNLQLALAVSTCPFVEVPYDPPGLPAERRDWLLPQPVEIAADGAIAPPPGPGLGVTPDFDALEQWRVG